MQTSRCPACGLTQLRQETCKRCGQALAPVATPPRPVRRAPLQPSRLRPYLGIWTQPRATIRAIVDADALRAVVLLAWMGGVTDILESASFKSSADRLPWIAVVAMALVLGPPLGFAYVYVGGRLTALTGRWLGGSADSQQCRAAIAWASVPRAAALALWPPVLAVLGGEMFKSDTPQISSSPARLLVFLASTGIWITLSAWAAVLLWKCLGEVHGFSAWRGFFASTLAWMMVLAFALGVVLLAMMLNFLPMKRSASPASRLSAVVAWVTT
jgi:hypothetical protein